MYLKKIKIKIFFYFILFYMQQQLMMQELIQKGRTKRCTMLAAQNKVEKLVELDNPSHV